MNKLHYQKMDREQSLIALKMLESDDFQMVSLILSMLHDHNSMIDAHLDDIHKSIKRAQNTVQAEEKAMVDRDVRFVSEFWLTSHVWANQKVLRQNTRRDEQYKAVQAEIHSRGVGGYIPSISRPKLLRSDYRDLGYFRQDSSLV